MNRLPHIHLLLGLLWSGRDHKQLTFPHVGHALSAYHQHTGFGGSQVDMSAS